MPDLSPSQKTEVVIAIGSNLKPHQHITLALDALAQHYHSIQCSPVYKSFAKTSHIADPAQIYFNLVVRLQTEENIITCKQNLRMIEDSLGRERNHTDVTCDLDILLYGEQCTTINNIKVPHQDIDNCAYVLRPLADLLPDTKHPQKKQTFKQCWDAFSEKNTLEPVDFKWGNQLLSIQAICLPL